MKTITIKTLKKELLVIELPTAETKISIGLHCIGIKPPPIGKYASDINGYYHIYTEMFHGFKLLGSPDEIKEEDVIDLVGEGFNISTNKKVFNDYNDDCNCFKTAIESFHSALESVIFWDVNPLGEEEPEIIEGLGSGTLDLAYENKQWNEAQEKTFDKKRTIIFYKDTIP